MTLHVCWLSVFVLVAGILTAAGAYAAEAAGGDGLKVAMEGARRTRQSYIEATVRRCIAEQGVAVQDADPEELRQCIYNTRLFSSVTVGIEGRTVTVKVEERWTLIPLPRYESTDGDEVYGGFVFESNFLGRGKKIALGGTVGDVGDTVMLFYMDPSVLYTNWTMKAALIRTSQDVYAYSGTEDVYGYAEKAELYALMLGYRLTPRLSAGVGVSGGTRTYSQLDSYSEPEDYDYMHASMEATYDDTDYKLYFNEGLRVKAGVKQTLWMSDHSEKGFEAELDAQLNLPLWRGLALELGTMGVWYDGDDVRQAERLGGGHGTRGIEREGLWVESALAGSVDLQVPVMDTPFGVWTVAPFFDAGVFDPLPEIREDDYFAYGVGTYLHLKKVGVPAMGIIIGRNENFMGDFATFFLGMQMM